MIFSDSCSDFGGSVISSSMSNYEFYQPMGAPNGRYPQMGAGGRAPVRASSVTDIHSLYSGLPGMLIIFQNFPKFFEFLIYI